MSSPAQPAAPKPVSTWRKVFAAILDFIFIFAISGYVVASITGNTTESGFDLKGGPAFIVFAIIILYFILSRGTWAVQSSNACCGRGNDAASEQRAITSALNRSA